MGKKAELLIKEDLLSLKKSLFEAKTMTAKRRIQSLVFIKEEKFETRQHLADYLCIHIRTLEKWLVRYKSMGLSQLISIARRGKRSQEMNPHIHQSLKEKMEVLQITFAPIKKLFYGQMRLFTPILNILGLEII